ncbi:MAG: aldo/keto reductase [Pseudonocardiaceae bacterium]
MPMGWSTGANEAQSLVGLETAWRCGARLYDTADVYGHGRSERLLGRLVAQIPRHEIVLSSKVGYFAGTAEHGFEPRHMRRQLEQSLDNLQTDHLDIYALHHPNFGTSDRWLQPAIDAMLTFRDQGLIRAIGMRGPHRFALDRISTPPDQRADVQRAFSAGDHRIRKRWFQPDAIEIINTGLDRVRAIVGPRTEDLIRVALWGCPDRSPNAVVLVGFTNPDQVAMNLGSLSPRPDADKIAAAREIMAEIQIRLDTWNPRRQHRRRHHRQLLPPLYPATTATQTPRRAHWPRPLPSCWKTASSSTYGGSSSATTSMPMSRNGASAVRFTSRSAGSSSLCASRITATYYSRNGVGKPRGQPPTDPRRPIADPPAGGVV